jgi:hypothetical protein
MTSVKPKRQRIRWGVLLILSISVMAGCSGIRLPESYVDTARFLDARPVPDDSPVFQMEVKPFEHRLARPHQVGIKRVGVNEINGPLLPSQDVLPIVQNSVLTQLSLQGIKRGASPLQLEGTLRDFFVDVDVDPATGRGRFNAIVGVDLAVWDQTDQRHIWQETYTGTATSSAPSVIDSAYERTLQIAFTNLMNQLRQDDSLLKLVSVYKRPPPPEKLPDIVQRPPPPAPPAPPTSPQIVFLKPLLSGSSQITTTEITLPISGLVASVDQVKKFDIKGAKVVRKEKAPPQLLQQTGLPGSGIHFQAFAFLTPGNNRVQIQAEDAQGHKVQQSITIQRQTVVDHTPPQVVVLEPHMPQSLPLIAVKPSQAIFGYAADENGIAEVQVNGTTASMTVASPRELQEAGLKGKGVKFAASTALAMGDNPLEITVQDIQRNKARAELIIQRGQVPTRPFDIKTMYPKSVAVVIGIEHYEVWPRLTYAVKDARHVQETLKDVGFDEVLLLTDHEATRGRLLNLFETELPEKVTKNDRVVIFFAGHVQTIRAPDGHQVEYLLPVDAQQHHDAPTGIAMAQIRQAIERLHVKHLLYAIDACHAGPFSIDGASREQSVLQKTRLSTHDLVAKPAIQLVAAGCEGEPVVAEEGQGLFARFLGQGLQGEADMDNDQFITASELGMYLSRRVAVTSDNRQIPQYGQLAGTGQMVFVY